MATRTRCGMMSIQFDARGQRRRLICTEPLIEVFTATGHFVYCPHCDRPQPGDPGALE